MTGFRWMALALASIMAAVLCAGLVGCAGGVDRPVVSATPDSGLTPLQRGHARDAALAAAEKGWAAWTKNDTSGMRPFFSDAYVKYYEKLYAGYAKEGRTRVRAFNVESFDVMDLNETATQALAEVKIKDRSYFVDRAGRKSAPSGKEASVQLTLEKQADGTWKIVRMTMAADILD